jgi:mannose-binding lectin
MSNGPVSGNGIQITLPPNLKIYYSGMTQAALSQFIQLKDMSGNVIFTLTGSGPWQTQSFTSNSTGQYKVYIGTSNGAAWSSVIWDDDALTIGSTVYFNVFSFISEDAGDQDFNDSYLSICWFQFQG